MGLSPVAAHPAIFSDTVTAIRVPDTIDARDVLSIAYHEFNTSFGSGLARLAGKVFRIGHLGDLNVGMCLTALSVAELSLARAGMAVNFGAATGAAASWYASTSAHAAGLQVAAE